MYRLSHSLRAVNNKILHVKDKNSNTCMHTISKLIHLSFQGNSIHFSCSCFKFYSVKHFNCVRQGAWERCRRTGGKTEKNQLKVVSLRGIKVINNGDYYMRKFVKINDPEYLERPRYVSYWENYRLYIISYIQFFTLKLKYQYKVLLNRDISKPKEIILSLRCLSLNFFAKLSGLVQLHEFCVVNISNLNAEEPSKNYFSAQDQINHFSDYFKICSPLYTL